MARLHTQGEQLFKGFSSHRLVKRVLPSGPGTSTLNFGKETRSGSRTCSTVACEHCYGSRHSTCLRSSTCANPGLLRSDQNSPCLQLLKSIGRWQKSGGLSDKDHRLMGRLNSRRLISFGRTCTVYSPHDKAFGLLYWNYRLSGGWEVITHVYNDRGSQC